MGPKGAKMVGFEEFSQSLEEIQDSITKISKLSIEDMVLPNSKGWELAETIYNGINVMNSNVSLVGNSKVMTHLISHLFAPIDRRYTLEFLYGSKSITGINEYQWELFKKIHLEFYIQYYKTLKYKI